MVSYDDTTGTTSDMKDSTAVWSFNYISVIPSPPDRASLKEQVRLENAAKSVQTLFLLMREFSCNLMCLFIPVTVSTRRLMFCNSGYLPNRIYRKKKS